MAYAAIPFVPVQKDDVLKLWRDALYDPRIGSVGGERFAWLYEQNPMGRPETWLGIRTDTGDIIGCGSVFPRTMRVRGTPRRAGLLADFGVVKAHRVGGCAMTIQRAILEHWREGGFEFVLGYPNKSSAPVLQRVGYTILGESRSYTKPLSTEPLLASQAQAPGLAHALTNPWIRAATGHLVDTSLALLDRARLGMGEGRYRVHLLPRADERHDELWRRCEWQHVMNDKSSRLFNWRYADHKTEAYRFFYLEDRSAERLIGAVVYTINENKAFIADLLTARLDADIDVLLLNFAMQMRREGRISIYVSYFGDEALGQRLATLQFFRGECDDRHVVLLVNPELASDHAATLSNPKNWLMFDGDLDI